MLPSIEQRLARLILGQDIASILMSDAYKFAMAQAGFALRREKFVLAFRKGDGPYYIPVDLAAVVQHLLPALPSSKEAGFLAANGYPMTTAMEKAIETRNLTVLCPQEGSWIAPKEPVLTTEGPSFLASWPEWALISLQYACQIATAMKHGETEFHATCEDEADIIRLMAEAVFVGQDPALSVIIHIDEDGYRERVRTNIKAVIKALGGEAHRAFEVGMRAATCMQQHLMVLEECKKLGIQKTSNVFGAWKLYMIPVGTTGHEHQMRWDAIGGCVGNDMPGFEAIRDMRPEPPSYLFDTFKPEKGIIGALRVIAEDLLRVCTMRFDSGDQDSQAKQIVQGYTQLVKNQRDYLLSLLFEDSYNAEKTEKNEKYCDEVLHWPRERRMYGYGGFFVSQPHITPHNRDKASAAYKLACTGGVPVRKHSGTPAKSSLPGNPIILEIIGGGNGFPWFVQHMIAQEGEVVEGYGPCQPLKFIPKEIHTIFSPQTQALIDQLDKKAA